MALFWRYPKCRINYTVNLFSTGDTVKVTTHVHVRTDYGTNNPEILDPDYHQYAPVETTGIVLDGPQTANGNIWWKVDYGPGLYSGWSIENSLEKVINNTPNPINPFRIKFQ